MLVAILALTVSKAAPAGAQGATERPAEQGAHSETTEAAAGGIVELAARLVNFAILVGVLVYLFRSPLLRHLAERREAIRSELREARALQQEAVRQIEEVEARLRALPQHLEALRARGLEEIAGEERRIAELAEAERRRVLEQARREVDLMLRVARRELLQVTADLAVAAATTRIRSHLTPADHERLAERYLDQLGAIKL